ncbi:hypothetical protein ACIQCM_05880 [Pseudarthrobacter sp. NPDC092439]|uniref:hypothetical protein n=1 Tax=unclassified Pseudarthrobacter TaxID=2647000 RepID=UPI003801EF76
MPHWFSETLSYASTTIGGAVAGILAEKFLNITGRVIYPVWNVTGGKVLRRRRTAQDAKLIGLSETFAVGAAKHQIYIRQFAPRGFSEGHLTASRLPDQPAPSLIRSLREPLLPASPADLEAAILEKRAALEAAPEAWNAEKIALRRIRVSRAGNHEAATLDLGYAVTDYASFQTIADAWEKRYKSLDDAGRDLTAEDLWDVLPGLSNSFGINLTLETADDHLVLTQRSGKASSAKNLRHVSVNEGMALADINPKTDLPDPYLTAIRGVEEELGIDLGEEPDIRQRITFHSLICDVTRYEWALLGHVNLSQTKWTNAEIHSARKLGAAPDGWESSELTFISLDPKSIGATLADDSTWVGHGYINLLLSAVFRLRGSRTELLNIARSTLLAGPARGL